MTSDPAFPTTPDHATAFTKLYRTTQTQLFRRNVLVAAAFYVAFVSWDFVVAPEIIGTTLQIRMLMLGLCALLFLASWVRSFEQWYALYYVASITSAAMGVAAILWFVPQGFAIGITGVALCITASSAIFRASGWVTASAGGLATMGSVALMAWHGEPDYLIRSHAIFLVAAVGFALLHSVQAQRAAYEVFHAQERLRSEKTRTQNLLRDITTMRQERLTWLENLARFLRHELKNQIVAVGTSIDLAQTGDSLAANRIYLDRAQRSLSRMRGLVSSATEATSLEAALAADEMDVVDLSTLVADRVLTFQQLHPTRQLVLRPKPGLFLQGNEERLAQLLDKLLNNAVEHSAPDAEIHVTLRRADESWFELSVENEGDPLPADKERIFEAFVSSQRHADNLGLGLFVAQSIARNHGGWITAEGLSEGSGARFVVRLPEAGKEASAAEEKESRVDRAHRPARDEDQPPQ
jgi:signal transduction histidine kinase